MEQRLLHVTESWPPAQLTASVLEVAGWLARLGLTTTCRWSIVRNLSPNLAARFSPGPIIQGSEQGSRKA